MQNAVWEYIGLSSTEKTKLWKDCTFVFDANILLNLYRYSRDTSDKLLYAFTELSNRIWLPYQVAYEFMKNRCEVIVEVRKKYDSIEQDKETFLKKAKSLSNSTDTDPAIQKLCKSIDGWIAESKLANIRVASPADDDILKKVVILFEGKTGAPYDDSKVLDLKAQAEKRFAKRIPPGFADHKKKTSDVDDNNAYGDFFTWCQIIDYAKLQSSNIILVTNDQKEDWWQIAHGETIGPRVELRKEFVESTGKQFHMYSMNQFLELYKTSYKRDINQSLIDEVSRITMNQARHNKQYLTEIDRIAYNISKRQEKIRRMQQTISSIEQKYSSETIPDEIKTQHDNTMQNMIRIQRELEVNIYKYNQLLSQNNNNL